MAYINFEFFEEVYGSVDIPEAEFNRLLWNAEKDINDATTGIDGYKKLQRAFPTDEYTSEAVKRCVCELVHLRHELENISKGESTANGIRPAVISSVSAGNESISYAVQNTAISAAAVDKNLQVKLYRDTVREYLSGLSDANGVNLLYMGEYPRGLE